VAALVLGALVAVAILLFRAQTDARESAQRSFAERAHISAALTQSVFSALGGASGADLLRRYGGPPKDLSRGLAEQLRQSHLSYLAVLDARGKTLATEGRSPGRIALATASLKRPALSNVVGRGADSVIE